MNEEFENNNGFENEQKTDDGSYYGKYTDGATTDSGEQKYTYKTVMDGVPRSRGWSVASMVLGILSILCCCLNYGGLILGGLAVIFAIISRRNLGYFDGMAIAGLVTGIIGVIFGIMMIITVAFLNANPEIFEEYQKYLEELEAELGGSSGITDSF